MKTFIIDRDEHSELPCEGVFWVVGDTLICFVEPMNYSSDSDVNYLNYILKFSIINIYLLKFLSILTIYKSFIMRYNIDNIIIIKNLIIVFNN